MNTLEISKNKLQEIRKAEEYFQCPCDEYPIEWGGLKVIAISSVQENEGNQPLQPTWPLPLRVRVTRPSWSTVISGTLS